MDRSPGARLAAIARRQAGAFNRTQATASRVMPKMLRTRVTNGEVEQLDVDVWAFTSAASWLRDCWAAALLHPLAALSHETAPGSVTRGRPATAPP